MPALVVISKDDVHVAAELSSRPRAPVCPRTAHEETLVDNSGLAPFRDTVRPNATINATDADGSRGGGNVAHEPSRDAQPHRFSGDVL